MKPTSFSCSVILAAHGSMATADANQPLFDLARQIQDSGIFSVVTPAFLNGNPEISKVFAELPAGDVVIIPVMTSAGYYLNQVIPKKFAQNPGLENYRVFMTAPLGTHSKLPCLVIERVQILFRLLGLSADDTSVIIVGHGTRRNPDSGRTTEHLADQIRQHLTDHEIRVAFIDQDPTIERVIGEIHKPNMLVVPFLISRGPHTTVDVPEAFGLPTGPDIEFPLVDQVGSGMIVCDLPVGMYPEVSELCLELAADQLMTGQTIDFSSVDDS